MARQCVHAFSSSAFSSGPEPRAHDLYLQVPASQSPGQGKRDCCSLGLLARFLPRIIAGPVGIEETPQAIAVVSRDRAGAQGRLEPRHSHRLDEHVPHRSFPPEQAFAGIENLGLLRGFIAETPRRPQAGQIVAKLGLETGRGQIVHRPGLARQWIAEPGIAKRA